MWLLGSVACFFRLTQSETPFPSPHNPRSRPEWCHILAEYELSLVLDRAVSGCRPMRAVLGH
jgi:hypothetical protein